MKAIFGFLRDLNSWPKGPIIWALLGTIIGEISCHDKPRETTAGMIGGGLIGFLIGGYFCLMVESVYANSVSCVDCWDVENGFEEKKLLK